MQNKYIKNLGNDIPASIVVFLIAIPLCLGVAVASGVSEFSGIIAGIVGGIVIGIISGSQLSVSGPAAGLTAIVATAVSQLQSVEMLFLAVLLAGVIQIVAGIARLGVIADFFPNGVIKGMLAGIGVILILKQIPHLVGYNKDYEGDLNFIEVDGNNTFSSLLDSLNHITLVPAIIGIVGLLILMVYETKWFKSKKIFQIISGPLVVVTVGVLIDYLFRDASPSIRPKPDQMVQLPTAASAKEFFSFFKFPSWQFISDVKVWMLAGQLALVASLETLLSIEAVDKLDPLKRFTHPNRELVAQGVGNTVSGFLGGLPLTSVIVRSSANVNAGGKTKMSAIFHGILILVCVAFIPNVLNLIPKAALAAVLVFTGYKLCKPTIIKAVYKQGWNQFVPFIVTIIAVVFLDLLKGVGIGLLVAVFYIVRSNYRTAITHIQDGNNHIIRFKKDVTFFSKGPLKNIFENIEPNAFVIIDTTQSQFIDEDIIETLKEFQTQASDQNITISFKTNIFNKPQMVNPVDYKPDAFKDDSAH